MKEDLIKSDILEDAKESFVYNDDGKTIFEAYLVSDKEIYRNLCAQRRMEERSNKVQKDRHLENAVEALRRRGVCSCGR